MTGKVADIYQLPSASLMLFLGQPIRNNRPEWLLLEIEGAVLIRDVRADLATRMQSPVHGRVAVMQLNTGEGKSSVIVPILITSLADGDKLMRVLLMGIEHKTSCKNDTADRILQLHEYMRRHSRDVVDESDENFSPRFELVYSLGQPQAIDHSPERWTCIREVLNLVRKCLPEVQHDFPMELTSSRDLKVAFHMRD
ncbi:uncharacterized protein B0I36DRAFT_368721 [Microdochium trichocladiopsis]|uniref:ubiquitinyl hydrolase 1 n=1 Tax=Microdochium trichocladiopsis TaxID=1682393 RepID=A0A9P9BM63_9PEZI|nr:uncharacterized protein B0I36DRAFT_368721 [Microdochium trichocladiopsis]KAH7016105.1 hypothetical protein B0I36DRAFT_368721 [Microdochium trichocladiopsis]